MKIVSGMFYYTVGETVYELRAIDRDSERVKFALEGDLANYFFRVNASPAATLTRVSPPDYIAGLVLFRSIDYEVCALLLSLTVLIYYY